MLTATDRDLLLHEPRLAHDLGLLAQQRLHVADAAIAGTTLTSAGANFVAAQTTAGAVALLNDRLVEVVARLSATTLTVSLLRPRLGDAPIPPGDASDATLTVLSFEPQLQLVHDALLAMLGLEDDEPIVSLSAMARLETLGTLAQLFACAATLDAHGQGLERKAEHHRRSFAAALRRTAIQLDLDGDGLADATRCLGALRLVRD